MRFGFIQIKRLCPLNLTVTFNTKRFNYICYYIHPIKATVHFFAQVYRSLFANKNTNKEKASLRKERERERRERER